MSFQAYLENIKAKTGKTPDDFRQLAAKKGLTKYPEVLTWLKSEFGLGYGHANAIAQLLVNADKFQASPDDKLAAHFKGDKVRWRETYTVLMKKLARMGEDVKAAPTGSYISLLRRDRKFGIVQISTANRIDIGIKLKNVAPIGRFEAAGTWNNLVTHRVRISDPSQIDAEVLSWLKQAYEAAQD
ncbi:MAG: hypothetical protein A2029_02895 [Chloroflexi bacterium RBG_19FT_COMBO_47_9]|nr:MAG: hypothetical protein A2029_02895 [Chloroflexi bacterium RBG_19FT_COMBO_47_9]